MRFLLLLTAALLLGLVPGVSAQSAQPPGTQQPDIENPPPPRSDNVPRSVESLPDENQARPGVPPPGTRPDRNPGESSSRTAIIDLSPPAGDRPSAEDTNDTGVNEMHPWDPLRAAKDIEVGDYYMKEQNYRAAESRYREALIYKPKDAIATFRLAQVFDKTGRAAEAQQYYENYLKILPNGPYARDAKKALTRLQSQGL
jgi:tetratricopeptide (TPR) repeat protein